MNPENKSNAEGKELEQLAGQRSSGFLADVFGFLAHTKKWWITPIVVILLMLGVLVVLSGTAAAPFIYTLF
jgi:Family of unknown function (DUF5989)